MAVGLREQQLVAAIGARLSTATRCAVDVLANTQAPGQLVDADQKLPFLIRSDLAAVLDPLFPSNRRELGGDTR
jgi:hypothetical protein